MVAAAPKEGLLKPAVALALLAGILLTMGAIVVLSEKTQLQRRVSLEKSPEVLQEKARNILLKFGYQDPPHDSTYSLATDGDILRYAERRNPALLNQLADSQPAAIYFWYRQSPLNLSPRGNTTVRATYSDPPRTYPGMTSVDLDPKGRLIEFLAVPPPTDKGSQTSPAQFDWAVLFEAAGLNQSDFTAAKSEWVPPVNSDTRVAWEGKLPNQTQLPIRLEAASFAGKPVFFTIVGPWNSRGPIGQPEADSLPGKIVQLALLMVIVGFFVVGILLGRKNLRDGSGDRKGGARLAVYMFLALMVSWVFRAHHYPFNEELGLLQTGVNFALLPAVLIWLFYLAVEPYVRRWWPHRMVSWSRLLAGDFRDPLIGRDILVGAAFGVAIIFVVRLRNLTPGWFGHPQAPSADRLYTLLSVREMVGEFFYSGVTAMVFLGGHLSLSLAVAAYHLSPQRVVGYRSRVAFVHGDPLTWRPALSDQPYLRSDLCGAADWSGHEIWIAGGDDHAVFHLFLRELSNDHGLRRLVCALGYLRAGGLGGPVGLRFLYLPRRSESF
jgi:serine/threonine-protein kinase